jgi:hypothetical protein
MHDGNFNGYDLLCLDCQARFECEWLHQYDEYANLTERTLDALLQALEFSLEYVDGKVAEKGHDRAECQCDNCQWLRHADPVYMNGYRMHYDQQLTTHSLQPCFSVS